MLKIVINPCCGGKRLGHQSFDHHASIVEKNYILDLSLKMQNLLSQNGMNVTLTRTKDEDISFKKRASMTLNQDILLSNHLNAGKKRGIEIRFNKKNGDVFARNLASAFENHGFLVRSCKEIASDGLLNESHAKESVMIFYGYVDSSDYARLMVGQNDYCHAVLKAIKKTFG